jgi:hypothetical protein
MSSHIAAVQAVTTSVRAVVFRPQLYINNKQPYKSKRKGNSCPNVSEQYYYPVCCILSDLIGKIKKVPAEHKFAYALLNEHNNAWLFTPPALINISLLLRIPFYQWYPSSSGFGRG